jgi:hypothetical protein
MRARLRALDSGIVRAEAFAPELEIKGPNEPLISLCLTPGPDWQLARRISPGKNKPSGERFENVVTLHA